MAQDMFNPAPPPQGGNGGSFAQKMPMQGMGVPNGMRPRPQMGQPMNRPMPQQGMPMNRMGMRPPMMQGMAGRLQQGMRPPMQPPQTVGQPQQIDQMQAPPMQPPPMMGPDQGGQIGPSPDVIAAMQQKNRNIYNY